MVNPSLGWHLSSNFFAVPNWWLAVQYAGKVLQTFPFVSATFSTRLRCRLSQLTVVRDVSFIHAIE